MTFHSETSSKERSLVKRLRILWYRDGESESVKAVCDEAADEIERLTRELSLAILRSWPIEDERDSLKLELDSQRKQIAAMTGVGLGQEEQLTRLRRELFEVGQLSHRYRGYLERIANQQPAAMANWCAEVAKEALKADRPCTCTPVQTNLPHLPPMAMLDKDCPIHGPN